MNIITNIIYEIEQPIITNAFKEFFSISNHLPYVYEALSIIQKYNLELIYKIILPIHNKISSEEYKERAIIIITQLNGYLVQHSNKIQMKVALLHKDLKCKAPLIEPNLRRNLDKWST